MNQETIDYYNENSDKFIGSTVEADISGILERFLSHVPEGGRILDWGCGSGRDTLAMLLSGYDVTAVDASVEMVAAATKLTGIQVRHESFEDLDEVDAYDGIWACSSLLHVPRAELPSLLRLAEKALRSPGCMYVSFKYGNFEGMRNGRYFTDLDEESLTQIVAEIPNLRISKIWVTHDVRPGRSNELWLNALLLKRQS